MITIHKVSFNRQKGFTVEAYQANETPKTYTVEQKDNPGKDMYGKKIINKQAIGKFDSIFSSLSTSGTIWCLDDIEGHKAVILKEIRSRVEGYVAVGLNALVELELATGDITETGLSARVTLSCINDGRK